MEGLDAWWQCTLHSGSRSAATPLARAYSPVRARTAARRCGTRRAACGTDSCRCKARTRDVHHEQRLLALLISTWHSRPGEGKACQEAAQPNRAARR